MSLQILKNLGAELVNDFRYRPVEKHAGLQALRGPSGS